MGLAKWIFAGLGWALGGPIGALLGFILGQTLDNASASLISDGSTHRGPYHNTGTQADVNVALMVLIAAVMKADGQVKKSELNYVKSFLLQNYGEERGKEMLKVLQQLVKQDISVDQVCAQLKVNTDYTTRYHMVDFLFGLGGADGSLHPAELNLLRLISHRLAISPTDLTSILERHVGSRGSYSDPQSPRYSATHKDPYKVLGISKEATDDEVKKAYRRMAMTYHPARVAGMGEEMQRNAAEQMKEINEAYEQIKHLRPNIK